MTPSCPQKPTQPQDKCFTFQNIDVSTVADSNTKNIDKIIHAQVNVMGLTKAPSRSTTQSTTVKHDKITLLFSGPSYALNMSRWNFGHQSAKPIVCACIRGRQQRQKGPSQVCKPVNSQQKACSNLSQNLGRNGPDAVFLLRPREVIDRAVLTALAASTNQTTAKPPTTAVAASEQLTSL